MTDPVFLRPAAWVYWNAVDSELVLFDTREGRYHALNASASAIWRLLAETGERPSVVATLQQRFPEFADRMADEVDRFIEQALQLGLLVAAEPPSP